MRRIPNTHLFSLAAGFAVMIYEGALCVTDTEKIEEYRLYDPISVEECLSLLEYESEDTKARVHKTLVEHKIIKEVL